MSSTDNSKMIYINKDNCTGCSKCILECPIKYANISYIEDKQKKITIEPSRCLHCGHCIEVCDHKARGYNDDTEAFFNDLFEGQRISVIAAPSLRLNIPDYKKLFGFLKSKGVNVIYDVSDGVNITSWAYLKILRQNPEKSFIGQSCPTIVNYIEKYHPELIQHLIPIQSPAICSAIYLKKYRNVEDNIAFLSPCMAKGDEFKDANTQNTVHYNVTYKKLLEYLDNNSIDITSYPEADFVNADDALGYVFSRSGGLKENIEYFAGDEFWIKEIDGYEKVYKYLTKYSDKVDLSFKLPNLIDVVNCFEGCNLGSATCKNLDEDAINYELNNYKKNRLIDANTPPPQIVLECLDNTLCLDDFLREYSDKSAQTKTILEPSYEDYERIFRELYKESEESRSINCYACGYGSCRKFVKAIYNGLDDKSSCIDYSRQLEMNMMSEKELAEEANIAKRNFLANMSHELRTPMNGVLGFINLLSDTELSEEQKDYIIEAKKSSETLLDIINDILDFSKIEAGQMTMVNVGFDIRSLIEDVTLLAVSNAGKKGVEVNSLVHSDVPQKVYGDPGRLKQVLNNLVNNAVKFTSYGEVLVVAKKEESTNNSVLIKFEVSDTGIGIPKNKLDMIFESFKQADSSKTRKYGGTGLGLSISKKLVEMMSGKIGVESDEGNGSVFTFTARFGKNTSFESSKININPLCGTNVLIVANSSTNVKITEYYLNEAECNIFKAKNSSEAFSVLNSDSNVDVIIIDYVTTDLDIMDFASKIRTIELFENIPLVLVISYTQRGDAKIVSEAGFSGYLTKPIRKDDLLGCISLAIKTKNESKSENRNELITKHNLKENIFNTKLKILIVEDNPINQKLTAMVLNKANFMCDVASNGSEAVDAYSTRDYDLILMDCQMPVMDGYEATKQIRELEKTKCEEYTGAKKHLPIIALTANAFGVDIERCFAVGMDDYICKPIDAKKLIEIIRKHVNEDVHSQPQESSDYLAGVIISKIIEDTGLSHAEAKSLLKEYLDKIPLMVDKISKAISDLNFDSVSSQAHMMKGVCANLRIKKLSALCLNLEAAAKSHNSFLCEILLKDILDYHKILEKDSVNHLFK